MYAEKQQGTIYFKAHSEQKGVRIDLASGLVFSQATGKPYKSQADNNLRRLFIGQRLPEIFHSSWESILETTEPIALVALYWFLDKHQREHYAGYATTLQMVYNRQFEMSFNSVIRLHDIIVDQKLDRTAFINFIIQTGLQRVGYGDVVDFKIAQNGINVANLTDNQRRFVRIMVSHNIDHEKIKYIIRKMMAEHIEYVIYPEDIIRFFRLADELEQSYKHKNFLNGYASMRYLYEMNKEALMQKKVVAVQKDIFKLDTDDFYCIMPTTPKEFSDMGEKMSNCVAGYYGRVAQGRSIIVFVYDRHTNEPIINIEICLRGNGEYYINQFLGKQNSRTVYHEYKVYHKAYQAHLQTIKPE
jgi:hypothetical protein